MNTRWQLENFFIRDKENKKLLDKAFEHDFWEKVTTETEMSANGLEERWLKIKPPKQKQWMLIRCQPATNDPNEKVYEVKLKEEAIQKNLFDEETTSIAHFIIHSNKILYGQVVNNISVDVDKFLENLKKITQDSPTSKVVG